MENEIVEYHELHRMLIKYVSTLSDETITKHLDNNNTMITPTALHMTQMVISSGVDKYDFGYVMHNTPFITYRKLFQTYFSIGNRKHKLNSILKEIKC
jgi:hypothetical protein